MPFTPSSGVVEVEMLFTKDEQNIEMTFHVKVDGSVVIGILNTIAGVFSDWWDDHLRNGAASALTYRGSRLTDLTTATSLSTVVPYVGSTPNGAGTSPLAGNVTAAVTKATASRGRSYRGRNYMVGLDATLTSDVDHLSTGGVANLVGSWGALLSALDDNSTPLGVLSLFSGGSRRSSGLFTPVTTIRMDNTIDSQRRRLPGRGQ